MNDGMLLQINRQRNLIPEQNLKAALSIQEEERAAGKTPRPLLDILATQGELDSTTVRLIRTLMHRSVTDTAAPGNGEATVADGYHAIVESVIQPESPKTPSRAGWPKEVLDAEADLKNLFGQFVLVAQVGSGGSGTVYRAWDRRVSRYAGLKILHTMEPSALERFTREARIAGNLQHPSIATIYEVGEQDGRYYIAMKYIDGKPIDADPRSIPECLALIRDVCRALDYAHRQGIIHRDVKPANLLVDSADHVYVTDFGIAKQAAHDHTSTLSMTGTIIGTPKYLPPEQARGEAKRADARSDVYSVGATLYTLLAGRAPFPSSNVWETLESVMKRDPPPLTSLNAAVSPELERIVATAMAKDPAHRYVSAGALADELDRILQQRRYTGRYGLLRYLARKWIVVALMGISFGILIRIFAGEFFPVREAKEGTTAANTLFQYRLAAGKVLDGPAMKADAQAVKKLEIDYIQPLIAKDPKNLHYRILMARADHLSGDFAAATAALDERNGLAEEDYRIDYLRGLMKLEKYLDENPAPLPEPEAPPGLSLPRLAPPPADLSALFKAPAGNSAFLEIEMKIDAIAIAGVQAFLRQDWGTAAEALSNANPLPVIQKALHRATYFAMAAAPRGTRNWERLRIPHPSFSCRECLGSHLLDAYENPKSDLEAAAERTSGDPRIQLQVFAHMARRSVEWGLDPADAVNAADKLRVEGDMEMRGVLRAATTRWKALSASDTSTDYEKIRTDLARPESWMGKLAKIESLVSQGARLRLRSGNFDVPLKQALDLVKELPGNEWSKPRVLRAEIYLHQGKYSDAHKELQDFLVTPLDIRDLRAYLVSAETNLRLGYVSQARNLAKRANDVVAEHPEANCLWGTALLEEAKSATDPSTLLVQAVDYLSIALERNPEFIEARFSRAGALFLMADWAAMSSQHAIQSRLSAIEDLKVVLKQVEGLAPARTLLECLETLNREAARKGSPK